MPRTTATTSRVSRPTAAGTHATVEQVHETVEAVASIELSPPHPPRAETPEYARAHHFLIYEKKAPCEVCGVTVDTLADAAANPFHALALESHHYPISRSLMDACDPVKVHADFPVVYDRATLAAFVDSPGNLKVYCDVHHRSVQHGIHHLLPADFAVQKYLMDGYIVAAAAKNVAAALATDTAIEQAAGIEAAANAPQVPVASPAAAKPKRARKPRTPKTVTEKGAPAA